MWYGEWRGESDLVVYEVSFQTDLVQMVSDKVARFLVLM